MDKQQLPSRWVSCPLCSGRSRIKIREDTVMFHFPLYCPRCRQETVINIMQLKISIDK